MSAVNHKIVFQIVHLGTFHNLYRHFTQSLTLRQENNYHFINNNY